MVDAAAIKEVRDILDGLFADADAPEGYVHEAAAPWGPTDRCRE